jgi:ribonuclease VapC
MDSSVIVAALLHEQGGDQVADFMGEGLISTVNVAEVYAIFTRRGLSPAILATFLGYRGIEIVPLSLAVAETAGRMIALTASAGLSLGDRACLALGLSRQAMILTADRTWLQFAEPLGIEIKIIR